MLKSRFAGLLCLSAVLALSAGSAEAVQYRMRVLDAPVGFNFAATDINDNGIVLGNYYHTPNITGEQHVFVWDSNSEGNKMQDLPVNGINAYPGGINNKGQVVGFYSPEQFVRKAFLWDPNAEGDKLQDISSMIGASLPRINNNGQILGYQPIANGTDRSCICNPSSSGYTLQGFGTFGGDYSDAACMNDKGQVVGFSSTAGNTTNHMFLWEQSTGTLRDLTTICGSNRDISGFNNNGWVVGNYTRSTGRESPIVLWNVNDPNNMQTIHTPGTFAYATDINDKCQVVLDLWNCAYVWDPSATENKLQKLDTLGGWYTIPMAINNNGWIAGYSLDTTGVLHAVVWQPVPEPSSILALISGLAGLGGIAWRKRNS